MKKQQTKEEFAQLNLRVKPSWIEPLKTIARQESAKQNKDLSYLDMVKIAIQKQYNLED